MEKKNSLMNKISGNKFIKYFLPATLILLVFCDYAFAGTVVVSTISGMRDNTSGFFHSVVRLVANIGIVAGLFLIFSGLMSLYGSHVKKGAGGKPPSHGVTLLGCGGILIGLPMAFLIAAHTLWGHSTTTIGENGSQLQQVYAGVIGQDD